MASGNAKTLGFTYISLLFFIAVLGIGLAATAVFWQKDKQRENERELLSIGEEFRSAIALYYNRSPGAIKTYPRDLNDLLKDKRYTYVQRYLRRIYLDPMTGHAEWGTVPAPDGGIMGIYSLSGKKPIMSAGFKEEETKFEGASTYSHWKFVYQPIAVLGLPSFSKN